MVPSTRYGSYLRNDLSVPVYMQNGFRYLLGTKDTTFISAQLLMAPGQVVKYTSYPTGLSGVTSPRTSQVPPANTLWITINGRVKRYYTCSVFRDEARTACEKDSLNFFNPQSSRWTRTDLPDRDSVSYIFSISTKDSLEALSTRVSVSSGTCRFKRNVPVLPKDRKTSRLKIIYSILYNRINILPCCTGLIKDGAPE